MWVEHILTASAAAALRLSVPDEVNDHRSHETRRVGQDLPAIANRALPGADKSCAGLVHQRRRSGEIELSAHRTCRWASARSAGYKMTWSRLTAARSPPVKAARIRVTARGFSMAIVPTSCYSTEVYLIAYLTKPPCIGVHKTPCRDEAQEGDVEKQQLPPDQTVRQGWS